MKKVLYVAHENTKGGATLSLLNILDNLPSTVEPHILIPKTVGVRSLLSKSYRSVLAAGTLKEEVQKRNIPYIEVYYFLDNLEQNTNWPRRFFFSNVRQGEVENVENYVKQHNISLIHSNSSVVRIGEEVARNCGIPHVWHIRENAEKMFHVTEQELKVYVERIVENHSQKVFVSNNLQKEFSHLAATYGYKEGTTFSTIYNGVPLKLYEDRPERQSSVFAIYCFGTVYAMKGQKDLVYLASEMKKHGIVDFSITLVGEQKNPYYDELVTLAQKLEVEEFLHVIHFTKEIEDIRQQADLEITPSRAEPFGRVAVEAMNIGNPLIVTNVGGLDEIVQHGINGMKYTPGDIPTLYEYVMKIKNDAQFADYLRVEGKKRAQYYDIRRCTKQICGVYEQIGVE